MATIPEVELPRSLERSLLGGHPWIYRDHVPADLGIASGEWVRVRAGRFRGYGLWDADGALAIRIFSRDAFPNPAWLRARLERATELRAGFAAARTTAFRWVNGEGDGLPGVVVDRYGPFAVMVLDTEALRPVVPTMVALLREAVELRGIVLRTRGSRKLEVLHGRQPPERLVVEENGLRFEVDLARGQKTGQFLDQRDNRWFVGSHAAERRVLNLFAYTGGFSLYAAQGGAMKVTSVDISTDAVAAARANFALNGMDPDSHEFVVADVFEYLAECKEVYDLVICDPPSLARQKEQVAAATETYVRLNAAGLRCLDPRGFYAASSCTSQISVELFRASLARSAQKARRRLQIIRDAGQPMDHPVCVGHPEGRYLKFLMARCLPD